MAARTVNMMSVNICIHACRHQPDIVAALAQRVGGLAFRTNIQSVVRKTPSRSVALCILQFAGLGIALL
jgi:hypothetical protein